MGINRGRRAGDHKGPPLRSTTALAPTMIRIGLRSRHHRRGDHKGLCWRMRWGGESAPQAGRGQATAPPMVTAALAEAYHRRVAPIGVNIRCQICHPERSEGSLDRHQMLRFAQHDIALAHALRGNSAKDLCRSAADVSPSRRSGLRLTRST